MESVRVGVSTGFNAELGCETGDVAGVERGGARMHAYGGRAGCFGLWVGGGMEAGRRWFDQPDSWGLGTSGGDGETGKKQGQRKGGKTGHGANLS